MDLGSRRGARGGGAEALELLRRQRRARSDGSGGSSGIGSCCRSCSRSTCRCCRRLLLRRLCLGLLDARNHLCGDLGASQLLGRVADPQVVEVVAVVVVVFLSVATVVVVIAPAPGPDLLSLRVPQHPRLPDRLVPQQPPQNRRVRRLDVKPRPPQDQLDFPEVARRACNKVGDLRGQLDLGQPLQHGHDALGREAHGHGGVERVRRQRVLVQRRGPRERLGDGDEEVGRLAVDGRERLEKDPPVRADPEGPRGVVGLEPEGGEVGGLASE